MTSYEVVKPCYVPLGGGVKYKVPGQVVTLEVEEAKNLDGYVRPTATQVSVRNPDTGVTVRNPDSAPTVRNPDSSATIGQEVTQDAGEADSVDEGTASEIA